MNLSITSHSKALQLFEPDRHTAYSIEAASQIAHVSRRRIAVYCRYGLVSPLTRPEFEGWYFDDQAVRTLRRIEHLRTAYEMTIPGLWVVSELMREIEQLREELRFLRRR